MKQLITILLIAIPAYVQAQKPDVTYKLLEASYITLNLVDLGTTVYGLSNGAVEGNPILGSSNIGTIAAVKGVTVVGTVILGRLAYKNNPKAAKITMIALNVLSGVVVANNVSICIKLN